MKQAALRGFFCACRHRSIVLNEADSPFWRVGGQHQLADRVQDVADGRIVIVEFVLQLSELRGEALI